MTRVPPEITEILRAAESFRAQGAPDHIRLAFIGAAVERLVSERKGRGRPSRSYFLDDYLAWTDLVYRNIEGMSARDRAKAIASSWPDYLPARNRNPNDDELNAFVREIERARRRVKPSIE